MSNEYIRFVPEDGCPYSDVVVVDGELVSGQEITIKLSEKKVNFFWPEYLDYHLTEKTLAQTQV